MNDLNLDDRAQLVLLVINIKENEVKNCMDVSCRCCEWTESYSFDEANWLQNTTNAASRHMTYMHRITFDAVTEGQLAA